MSAANFLRPTIAGALALISVGALAGGARQNDRAAYDLLARTMKPKLKVNVVSITLQRDSAGENAFQQIKLVRSKGGKQRWTVLQPVRLAGIDSVDDGVRRRLYIPDLRQIYDMESPAKAAGDLKLRLDLAKRNYTFQFVSRPKIAGRETVCVSAVPKNQELDILRYYIDEGAEYPLRVESIGDDGRTSIMFDTKFVEYPSTLDRDTFKMSTLPGVKTFTYSAPVTLSKVQARAKVGFVPVVPSGLPMGFKVQGLQFNENPEWRSVMVRLTDGLVQATVYQWRPNGQAIRSLADSTSGEYNGIRLLVVSNQLGPAARYKLLQAFTAQTANEDPRALKITGYLAPRRNPLPGPMEPGPTHPAFSQIEHLLGLAVHTPSVSVDD
jgi:hypothetical protein